ncbi:hypothetical protein CEP51_002440 [Fusarium floridanum]|uniref:GED domain-containing protein n=1 Tax=Fusarium floridanum TaxID=1325733 RepID=A0A428SBI6_9HYPO|nr:hypothetical protein CEP51_002440 [Fusarium floridanum]
MDVSVDSDILKQLNTAEAKDLHDISDSLSACGVGKIVNLPQIIVVGEQSAGKSSVLEAISHVRFPVQGGLCTRFATELVLRQAPETRVDVSVRFADETKKPQAFQRTGFREDDLPDIIKEAQECMGFTRAGRDFSKDVLRLEIQGPGMYPLTLVDLPGLFHAETETQSLAGKETVDQLVESYMKQKNSIILVVVSANSQLASHVALRRVKDIDPKRQRTIGVITKPDLTHPGLDDEKTYIRVAKNQESANKLQLGWHVLRNRSEKEASLEARDEVEEEFFKSGAWAAIPENDRGIANLRRKLSKVLYDHIRNSLPSVVEDIENSLRERQEQLDRLGKPRADDAEKRLFLVSIAGEFQRLARDGIHGRYNEHRFFGDLEAEDRKLRAQLRSFNRAFDYILKTKGSKQLIVGDEQEAQQEVEYPDYLEAFLAQYEFPDPEMITTTELNAQLEKHAAANLGRELPGSSNTDLAIQLFKKQAAPWKEIAECHIRQVIDIAKAFVDDLFSHVAGPPGINRTTEAILTTCVDPFFEEKEKLLQDKLEELLRPYVEGYALPSDVDFYSSLSQRTMSRFASQLCSVLQDQHPELFDKETQLELKPWMITRAMEQEAEQGEFGTEKVIDMMQAYYEMSRRTFTDNVVNLAIESCLMCDIPKILTPTEVNCMSDERLSELADESVNTVSQRETLREEVKILSQGLALCRRYRPRPSTVRPSPKVKLSSSAQGKPANKPSTMKAIEPAPTSNSTYNTGLDALKKEMHAALVQTGVLKPVPATDANLPAEPAVTAKSNNILATAAAAATAAQSQKPGEPVSSIFSQSTGATTNGSVSKPVTSSLFSQSTGSTSANPATKPAAPTGGLFGGSATSTTKPAAPASSGFGSGGLFGTGSSSTSKPAVPTSSPFPSGGIFGSSASSTSIPATSSPSAFGSGGLFGGSAPKSPAPASSSGGLFGSAKRKEPSQTSEGQSPSSTTSWDMKQWDAFRTKLPFTDHEGKDQWSGKPTTERFQHICAASSFVASPEEHRLADAAKRLQ